MRARTRKHDSPGVIGVAVLCQRAAPDDRVPLRVAERRPGGHRRLLHVRRRGGPEACAAGVRGDLDLVARSARHAIPDDHRRMRGEAVREIVILVRGDRVVRGVVAHVEVLDARPGDRAGRRDLVERLVEGRAVVPDPRIALRVERTNAPVVDVVEEDGRRGERSGDARSAAADLRAGREVRRGVDLELVARGAGNRAPREARVVDLGVRVQVLHLRRGHRRPEPGERGDRRRDAAVTLGVHRRDAPVVRAGRERRGDRGRGGGDVRRALRVVLVRVAEDERAEAHVARDRDEIVRGARDSRPAEHDGLGRVGERGAGARALQRGLQIPELPERARLGPLRAPARGVRRAHAPVVRAVRDRLRQRRTRVPREEVVLAGAEHRRVHAGVGADLELVLVDARDRRPSEGREKLDDRAGGWRGLCRARHRATSGARRQEGDGGKGGGEKFAVSGHRSRERRARPQSLSSSVCLATTIGVIRESVIPRMRVCGCALAARAEAPALLLFQRLRFTRRRFVHAAA